MYELSFEFWHLGELVCIAEFEPDFSILVYDIKLKLKGRVGS
jgi:hypothetical protein